MATIFPSTPSGALPSEVLRVFRFLKALPDDWLAWHRLAPWQADAPDFLVIMPDRRAALVKVSPAARPDVRPAAQLLLLDDPRPPLGAVEEAALASFLDGPGPALAGAEITPLVLFPNLDGAGLSLGRPPDHPALPAWLGRESLQPGGLERWQACLASAPLNPAQLDALRARFCPEAVVPPALTVRTPTQRQLAAGLAEFLLDYDQEAALKADLDLPVAGQALSRNFRVNIVNGVAGSGKTLILLYRLRLLYRLYPGRRFLVLTHNRPLIQDMQARFYRLHGSLPESIEWRTFLAWCYHHWPASPPWVEPLGQRRRMSFLRAIWMGLFKDSNVTEGVLRSEIDWIKDQAAVDRQAYLDAPRKGSARLPLEQRQRVWEAYTRYCALLRERRSVDWPDVPRQLWGFMQDGRVDVPQYDFILVDEAQFFAPLWFEIVRGLVRPPGGHLFLAADPTQGFLRRGESWRSVGLDARGHTTHLRRSYRTTHEIFNFATLFYRQRVAAGTEEEEVLAPDLFDMPAGVTPVLIPLDSPQDEIARVANEAAAFVRRGLPRGDLLILHANWEGARALIAALRRKLGRGVAYDPKDDYPGNYVRVTTLNAGTGLEAPVVFLVGLHELFEEEQSLRLSDDERERVILENTRKIYMAATRAGQRLVFTYAGPLPAALRGLDGGTPGAA